MTPPDSSRTLQRALFSAESEMPPDLLDLRDLAPQPNLRSVFEACHDHIYANEGLLKDKIFNEIVKLILMKMVDEARGGEGIVRFGITSSEYAEILEGDRSDFEDRMSRLFGDAKIAFGRFFENDNGLLLSVESLAYVIAKLQRISLELTPRDVKGEAFQAFVYKHARGDRGEFFTPNPVVRLAVGILDPQAGEFIIDPAAGSGGFLIEAIRHISGGDLPNGLSKQLSENIQSHIRGIEFNPDIARAAMIRLAFEGGTGDEIECRNALRDLDEHLGQYDVLITNPPFGTKGRIQDQRTLAKYELAFKWVGTSDGGFQRSDAMLRGQTPEILFLERCIQLLKPGGRMAIVLPDGVLQNTTSAHIRSWLVGQADVFSVVSLPQETFIPYGTGIKTSLVFARKRIGKAAGKRIFFAKVSQIGYDVKGQPRYRTDQSGQLALTASGEKIIDDDVQVTVEAFGRFDGGGALKPGDDRFAHSVQVLNGRLDVEHYLPSDLDLIELLERAGSKRLGELADIVSRRENLESDLVYRYIAISDIDARSMRVINQQTVLGAEAPSRASFRVQEGDIVTAVSGASTGTKKHVSAIITDEENDAICSNGLAVLRNIRGIDEFYLLSYLRTHYFLRQVKRQMTGHAIPAISKDDLANIQVAIPSADVVQQISHKLRKAQRLRAEAQKASHEAISLVSVEGRDSGVNPAPDDD